MGRMAKTWLQSLPKMVRTARVRDLRRHGPGPYSSQMERPGCNTVLADRISACPADPHAHFLVVVLRGDDLAESGNPVSRDNVGP